MKYLIVFGVLFAIGIALVLGTQGWMKFIGWPLVLISGLMATSAFNQVRALASAGAVLRARPDLKHLSAEQCAGSVGETAIWAWTMYQQTIKHAQEPEICRSAFVGRYTQSPPSPDEEVRLDAIIREGRQPTTLPELCMRIFEVEMDVSASDKELYAVTEYSTLKTLSSCGYLIKART